MYREYSEKTNMATKNSGNGRNSNRNIVTAKDNLKPLKKVYDSHIDNQNEKLKDENKILNREIEDLKQKLHDQKKQYDILLDETDAQKKAKNRLSVEREKTILDVKKISVDQTLKDENSRLHDELNQLNIDNADLRKELDRARTSLSKIAGEKMTDGNPYITDLSDPQRPQKLSEKFNSLYDNSWTDAYEIFSADDMDEKLICKKLIAIFQSCWDFSCDVAKSQLSELHKILLSLEENGSTEKTLKNEFPVQNSKIIKETRRLFAEQFIPTLCESYWQRQKDAGLVEDLQPYVNKCIELCWYSAISDPPLVYAFEAKTNVDDFRGYTKSGDEIDYVVWPSMYLHEYGPLLYKGVVQHKVTDTMDDKPELHEKAEDHVTDKSDGKPELQEKTQDHETDKTDGKPELQEKTIDHVTDKTDGKPELQEKTEDHVIDKTDGKPELQEKTEDHVIDKTEAKSKLQEKTEDPLNDTSGKLVKKMASQRGTTKPKHVSVINHGNTGKAGGKPVHDSRVEKLLTRLDDEKSESKAKDKKIDDLEKKLSRVETKLEKETAEREKINHEHEKMISDLKHARGKNLDKTLREENDRLKQQIDKITIEKEDLGTEVDRLRTSLSKVAGDGMLDGNPFVTDLSDPNRPQRLAEKFNSLYDNSWTDAFEILSDKNKDEKAICKILLDMLEACWRFCSKHSIHQFSSLQKACMVAQLSVTPSTEMKEDTRAYTKHLNECKAVMCSNVYSIAVSALLGKGNE
ncbi:unnamed protein product [Mytilus coruscus]|uniref:Mitochondria-eating protein n=1 Tax=Mytilus coruscus TaxID=42192 RepID=A0A6J8DZI4_MYTCO|nr:unnamed protein product [Mytilus coruscus]